MQIVAAPRLLMKMGPAQAANRIGISGNTFRLRVLCPNEAGGANAIGAEPRWHLAEMSGPAAVDGSVSPGAMWEAAYEAARVHGVYAEPDLGCQWDYRNRVRHEPGAAPGDLCAFNDQAAEFPQGPAFAWHLDKSGLRAARNEVEALAPGQLSAVRIGHLDTGYDPGHHACPANVLHTLERNFVDDGRDRHDASDPFERGLFTNPGHGTGTLGLLAGRKLEGMARAEQNGDYLGGAPRTEILPVRVATGVVLLFTSAFAEGLDYLIAPDGSIADRVDVLSMSMGGTASRAWADAVNRAYSSGIAMVTAAGNNFPLTPESIVYPARFHRVIAACGVMADGRPYIRQNVPFRAMAGNYGPRSKMDSALAAYTPNTSWAEINCAAIVDMDGSGTSSATPQIAAAAALWLQKHKGAMDGWEPWQRVEAVRTALFDSAQAGLSDSAKYFGRGILRADRALGIAPVQAAQPTEADTAGFSFWKVIFGRGAAAAADANIDEMLQVEVAQLFHIDPDIAKTVPDPDAAVSAPPEFYDAVIGSPYASKTLKQILEAAHPGAAVPGADLKGKPPMPQRPRNQVLPTPRPVARRLRVYAIDPSLSGSIETVSINETAVAVPWERLDPGPSGEYVEVVDHDPATGCYYAPVDLDDASMLATDGLAPDGGDPRFHQQMVYAVAMRTIHNFEIALGRTALWSPLMFPGDPRDDRYVRRLRIYPHALREDNAYYNPDKKALLFGYFPPRQARPGELYPDGVVFTCLSHDIVAHETTHALLDGMHRNFNIEGSVDSLAFHEAFADIVALMQHFSLPEVLEFELNRVRADLRLENLLAEIGQEFGMARGMRRALRSAITEEPDPTKIDRTTEPHDRGSILVAAVFRAFVEIYMRRTTDLLRMATHGSGILRPGAVDQDLLRRLADEARRAARHVLTMCIRALDYCPPVDITFGEYLRAIITADFDVVPNDDLNYRVAFIESFRRWGIYPGDLQTLSAPALRWRGLQFDESQRILAEVLGIAREFAEKTRYLAYNDDPAFEGMPVRERIFRFSRRWRERLHQEFKKTIAKLCEEERAKLGLDLGLDFGTGRESFEVHALRMSEKTGPDNQVQCHLIVQLLQHRDEMGADGPFRFSGGCTVIVDEKSLQVKYSILKHIGNRRRLEETRAALARSRTLRSLYLGGTPFTGPGERFAIVHRMGEEAGNA